MLHAWGECLISWSESWLCASCNSFQPLSAVWTQHLIYQCRILPTSHQTQALSVKQKGAAVCMWLWDSQASRSTYPVCQMLSAWYSNYTDFWRWLRAISLEKTPWENGTLSHKMHYVCETSTQEMVPCCLQVQLPFSRWSICGLCASHSHQLRLGGFLSAGSQGTQSHRRTQ